MAEKSDIDNFKAMRALGKALAAMRPYLDDISKDYSASVDVNNLRNRIKAYRNSRRSMPSPKNRRSETMATTKAVLREMFEGKRKTVFLETLSWKVGARKIENVGRYRSQTHIGDFSVVLGWTWHRNIFLPFYKSGKLSFSEWLVLKADEIKVNTRMIRLYEATAFNYKEGKTREVYIGQSTLGGDAEIRESKSAAIERALTIARRNIDKEVLGETQ